MPLSSERSATTGKQAEPDKIHDKGKHVLILHRDSEVCSMLTQILSQNGFRVSTSTQTVTDASALQKDFPDLLIVAEDCTNAVGEPLCSWLRRRADVPIMVFCTGGDRLAGIKMLEIGADDFVMPPVPPRELIARVNRLLRRYRSKRGLP